jgi:N-acyl-L-homoserine lactone synthetase
MIEVVTSRNALLYQDALHDMFRLRPGERDSGKDRFDTSDAIYLLLTKDDGTVIGAHRLLPTAGPHLLSDRTPELCAVRGVLRGADILELSATFVAERGLDKAALENARKHLLVGLFEFCQRAGYETVTWAMPIDQLFPLLLIGLAIKPLGIPADREGVRHVAVAMTTDRAALDVLRLALHVPGAQVEYVGTLASDPLVLAPLEDAQQPLAAA